MVWLKSREWLCLILLQINERKKSDFVLLIELDEGGAEKGQDAYIYQKRVRSPIDEKEKPYRRTGHRARSQLTVHRMMKNHVNVAIQKLRQR